MTNTNAYDEVPYPSLCYTHSHPNHLAALGILLGMQPSPVEKCRVLELGCATGGNLIPMAYSLPHSQFVGLDYAERQITDGQKIIQALGLTNISLRHLDIRDITDGLGQFDYIIAHGVYSWVPPEVQDKVLLTFRQNLAPQGIGYISYNIYPGWHMLGMARNMMLYHTRNAESPLERARMARELINFLVEGAPSENSAYGSFLDAYNMMLDQRQEQVNERDDSLLLHDELEAVNEPVYFHEFAERAAAHKLQYLTEADFPTVMPNRFKPETIQKLNAMSGNIIEMEQYMDFLRNRTFRKTLICHDNVVVERVLKPERATSLFFTARIKPVSDQPDILGETTEQFESTDGARFSTNHPVSKAALLYLAKLAPRTIPFNTLLQVGIQNVYTDDALPDQASLAQDAQVLAANLLQAFTYSMKLMEIHAYQAPFVGRISEKPVSSHFARLQAQNSLRVTNLRHERVNLDTLTHFLLLHLDAEHDKAALLQKLYEMAETGAIEIKDASKVEQEVDLAMQWLALAALLIQ